MLPEAALDFPLCGKPLTCRELSGGKINLSLLLTTDRGARYVLQRVNRAVFPDIGPVMRNAARLQGWLERHGQPLPASIRYLPAQSGALWVEDEEGFAWRCYPHVEGVCRTRPESGEEICEAGLAFGRFLQAFADFPIQELEETIPRFHDTPDRFRLLREAVKADPLGRLSDAKDALDTALRFEEAASVLQGKRERGELPLRVTHNDTKFSNILFDAATGRARCVLDLDTVMPGLSACDFGDAARSCACVEAEDGSASLSLEHFTRLAAGFFSGCPALTEPEREALPLGALTVTVELGVRYLTDYLLGDPCFRTADPAQNLRRARRRLALAGDMLRKAEPMAELVRNTANKFT